MFRKLSHQDCTSYGWTEMLMVVSFALLLSQVQGAPSTHMSASVSSDMTKPTYGFHGQSSSSLGYNQQDGLAIKGQIGDLLGPPLKIANGVGNIITGSALSGMGAGMNTGSAILGIDSKVLDTVGGANLLKGGVNYGGALAKTAAATALGGLPGKMISSMIEFPVKVVALKDIKEGKAMKSMAAAEANAAYNARNKAQALTQKGDSMKINGLHQVLSGATEGIANIGNAVQTTANNAASALRILPIIMNLPDAGQVAQPTPEGQNNAPGSVVSTSGSLFSGFNNIIPGLSGGYGQRNEANSPYAAVINLTSPFNNIFNSPGINPFLFPLGNTNPSYPGGQQQPNLSAYKSLDVSSRGEAQQPPQNVI